MGHSLYTETKRREGDVEEERGEGQAAEGERWMERGVGGVHFVFPFRMAFMVQLQTLTSRNPRPYIPPLPRSIRPSIPPSLLFFTIVHDQVDSNWLFFHEADFSAFCPPQEEALLLPLRSKCICVYVCVRCKYARR